MKTWEKTGFGLCSDAEPCVFTIFLISMFPKPCVFAVVLARFGLAAAQWIAARAADFYRKACKKLGSGNMSKKKHVTTQGSAPGTRQDLVFSCIFLSPRRAFIRLSWFSCLSEGPLGLPPSWARNRPFGTKTGIAGSHFQKAEQIEKCRDSTLRGSHVRAGLEGRICRYLT